MSILFQKCADMRPRARVCVCVRALVTININMYLNPTFKMNRINLCILLFETFQRICMHRHIATSCLFSKKNYFGRRPQTVWGSGGIMHDNAEDDDKENVAKEEVEDDNVAEDDVEDDDAEEDEDEDEDDKAEDEVEHEKVEERRKGPKGI